MEHVSWLSNLAKALSALLEAIAERVALWVGRRKPKLYVHFNLGTLLWCIAQQQQRQGPPLEMMQLTFSARTRSYWKILSSLAAPSTPA